MHQSCADWLLDVPDPVLLDRLNKLCRGLLYATLALSLSLLAVDRYAAWAHRPTADSTRIVLYTTRWCGYCASLRMQLEQADVPYTEYDIEQSLGGLLGFWALRARGVPVTVAGPAVIYGYQVDELQRAFALLGHEVELVRP